MTMFLPQSANMTTTLLSLKDKMIRGLRQSLATSPGNKTFNSTYLSITVVSIRGKHVYQLKLNTGRSSFLIQDLREALKKEKIDNDTVFLEVWSNLQTACWLLIGLTWYPMLKNVKLTTKHNKLATILYQQF